MALAAGEATVTRSRRRREPQDPLPTPEVLGAEIRALIHDALRLHQWYRRAYVLGLAPPGGSGFFASGGQTHPTEVVVESRRQERMRQDCRRAVKRVREATRQVGNALFDLRWVEPTVRQPLKPAQDAVISLEELRGILEARRRREQRGEE